MFDNISINKGTTKNVLAAISVIALTVFWFWQGQRDRKLTELIAEASGRSTLYRVAPDPVSAVQMLAEFDNADAQEAILLMAGARPDTLPMGVQECAIRALAKQHTTEACHVLAQVLQSHFLSGYRAEAAKLLAEKKCDKLTVVYTLHYLNQIAKGERELESRFLVNDRPAIPEELIRERHTAVARDLYRMLDGNREATAEALTELYGIGTDSPTVFAIQLLRKAKFMGMPRTSGDTATSRLQQSEHIYSPRLEIQKTIDSLKCLENVGQ
ncbi:MAG: hypothetical protein LC114_14700 [Bryobacterales bacterium]|nr:hypothetical protein [Bryobacterales bacterium]